MRIHLVLCSSPVWSAKFANDVPSSARTPNCNLSSMSVYTSRNASAHLALEIWLEIFRYATYVPQAMNFIPLDAFIPEQPSNNAMGPNTEGLSIRTKCNLVLVCHAWRLVTLQLLYEYIPIKSPRRADLILQSLEGSRRISATGENISESYGMWTRHIQVQTFGRGSGSIQYLQKVFRICQHCPSLRIFSGIWHWGLPQSFHDAVSRLYGASLQGLWWEEPSLASQTTPSFATPSFFIAFQSVRVLHLNLHRGATPQPVEPRLVLSQVEHLVLAPNNHTFSIVAALQLPMLSRVTVVPHHRDEKYTFTPVYFLHVHGSNITYLDLGDCSYMHNISLFLNGCPNLQDFVYSIQAGPMNSLGQPHGSLRRIGLRGVGTSWAPHFLMKQHFRTYSIDVFPALEVVRTVGFLVAKSLPNHGKQDVLSEFIRWVEAFEQDGVDLQDGEGVVWLRSEDDRASESTRSDRC